MNPGTLGGVLVAAAAVLPPRSGADGGAPRTAMPLRYPPPPRCRVAGSCIAREQQGACAGPCRQRLRAQGRAHRERERGHHAPPAQAEACALACSAFS